MAVEARFPAMGSEAHVIVEGDAELLALARRRVDDLEQKWSRFIPSSEVSRLNARRGRAVAVSPETVLLVAAAVEAWRATDGVFDPTVLGDVVRAGYDRTFQAVAVSPGRGVSALVRNAGGIVVDAAAGTVALPADAGFDPGGIGKGLAADVVVAELLDAGAEGACVNLGGDVRVEGCESRWVVDIRHPADDSVVCLVALSAGAVATSTVLKRAWSVDGSPRHHLIDVRTGASARGEVVGATALARCGADAEVAAKVALLRGSLDGVDGLLVRADGSVARSAGLPSFEIAEEAVG